MSSASTAAFDAKKLLRSLLVFAPWIQDLRFTTEARVLRALKKPFRPEFAGLRALTVDDPLVLDIGCNRGISIETILSMMPRARVIGFEANPDVARATAALFADRPQVEVRPIGLGAAAEEHTLHVPVYRGYRFDGLGSFDPWLASALFDGRLLYWFDPKRLVIEEKRVTVRPLDDYDLEPTVMKLYVQGHETAIFDGATRTIARCEPVILAKSQEGGIDEALRRRGYRRYQWTGDHFEPEANFGYVVYYMTPDRARRVGL